MSLLKAGYNFSLWANMLKFSDKLAEDAKQAFWAVLDEGSLMARISLRTSLNGADSASRVMTSAMSVCRCLTSVCWFPTIEVQQTIQDPPFQWFDTLVQDG